MFRIDSNDARPARTEPPAAYVVKKRLTPDPSTRTLTTDPLARAHGGLTNSRSTAALKPETDTHADDRSQSPHPANRSYRMMHRPSDTPSIRSRRSDDHSCTSSPVHRPEAARSVPVTEPRIRDQASMRPQSHATSLLAPGTSHQQCMTRGLREHTSTRNTECPEDLTTAAAARNCWTRSAVR